MNPLDPGLSERLALVRLPARMHRALRLFRTLTGQRAVASVVTHLPESGLPSSLSPPLHPRCARSLRSVVGAPCGEQWASHLRAGRRSSRRHEHVCPIGLRCTCVPIHFGDHLVGVAKLVVEGGASATAFKNAVNVLGLVVSEACKDSAIVVLTEEVRLLRGLVAELRELQSTDRLGADGREGRADSPATVRADAAGAVLVNRAIGHLQQHFQDPRLSLRSVARALDCNPKYLTSRFSRVVGEHMHAYLVTLRVSHACGLLVRTDRLVKEIAAASGFPRAALMASAFRTRVGVSPREYRRIFAGP